MLQFSSPFALARANSQIASKLSTSKRLKILRSSSFGRGTSKSLGPRPNSCQDSGFPGLWLSQCGFKSSTAASLVDKVSIFRFKNILRDIVSKLSTSTRLKICRNCSFERSVSKSLGPKPNCNGIPGEIKSPTPVRESSFGLS
uniref:Uncharacterized protein n=1 Tax=Glossina palpalis gambiensis TaxID=67801 RepID=A0A1B0BJB0_9MUSC